ncbi:MAG: magnesium transporter, partial [Candidatus Omnitrophota bacterium]
EKRELLLKKLDNKKRKEIQELIEYPNNSAGRLMTKELMALHLDIKVKDAVHKIREYSAKGFTGLYVYVVDDNGCLVGVMNMRDMLLAEDEAQLSRVMRKNVFCVDAFMDSEEVANELTTRKFLAAPVIDQDKRLLGVVKSHQIIGEVKADAAEDIQRMFGAGGNERAFSPIWYSIKKRLPWLHVNLITAFMAASVVALFEDIISKLTILAVFLPVVAGQGGNAGAQSLAVVMRGLVMREIPINKAKKLVLKETILGAINGIVIGAVTALVAWMWLGNPYLGLVIGLGMVVNLIAAGFSGAAIPLVMKKVGLDPAQCSSIILTTITDIIGFFSFLGFAVLFQEHLI